MDELLKDFLTETAEHIEGAELQLLQFEREPSNGALIAGIFRLVHTIKGTCSFLGLQRLQKVAHAAETVMGLIRDGVKPRPDTISLILSAIDRIKWILTEITENGSEPDGDDSDIISALEKAALSSDEGVVEQPVSAAPGLAQGAMASGQIAQSVGRKGAQTDDAPPRNAETIRVAVDTIESIMQLVSELVLTRNQLLELTRRQENETVKGPLQRLSSLTTDLQDAVMRARMQPVGRLYSNLPRLVRELSSDLSKKLLLVTEGADTEIDRQLIEVIRDPLTHLIRNSADHGIETPEVRAAAGKSETGEIRVSASHEAGQITIKVSDDGRGLNVDKIAKRAVAAGLISVEELRTLSQDDLFRFVFEPGFSTADQVSSVSGRGVGMDVVRSNIEQIGGTVSVTSAAGRGTTFTMKIPLTLAIAPALIIKAGSQRFAMPQHSVMEVVGIGAESPHQIERIQNALILKLREQVLPAVELSTILGMEPGETAEQLAVIMKIGSVVFAIIVDDVLDVQEIVIKPLSASIAHLKIFSGRTILGDGSVVLILDVAGIANRIGIEQSGDKKREHQRKGFEQENTTKLVLFRAGPGALKALPLSVVARIETVNDAQLSIVDGRLVTLRQSQLMPVVDVSQSRSHSAESRPMLVIGQGTQAAGLLVDEVVDIIEEALDMQIEGSAPDCIGTAHVRGQPLELIDIVHYLRIARAGLQPEQARGKLLIVSDRPVFLDTITPAVAALGYSTNRCQVPDDLAAVVAEGAVDVAIVDVEIAQATRAAWVDGLTASGMVGWRLLAAAFEDDDGRHGRWLPTSHTVDVSDRGRVKEILADLLDSGRTRNEREAA